MKKIILSLIALTLAIFTFQAYLFFDDHKLVNKKYNFEENVFPKSIHKNIIEQDINFFDFDKNKSKVNDLAFTNSMLSMKIMDFESVKDVAKLNYDVYTFGIDSTSYSVITDKEGFILFSDINIKKPSQELIKLLQSKIKEEKIVFAKDQYNYYKIDTLNNDKDNISIVYELSSEQSSYDYISHFIFNDSIINSTIQFDYSKKNNEINIYTKNTKEELSYEKLIEKISHSFIFYIK